MSRIEQNSFSGGEIGEHLLRRKNTARYASMVRRLRNMLGQVGGGAYKRPGFLFGSPVKDHARKARVIPWRYSSAQGYALVFGHQTMRVVFEGSPIVEKELLITDVMQTNPVVVEAVAHGYATGDDVFIKGVAGIPEINGKTFRITKLDADTFSLDGIDGTGWAAFTTAEGGVAGDVEGPGGEGGQPPDGPVIPETPPPFEDYTPQTDQMQLESDFYNRFYYTPTQDIVDIMLATGRVPEYWELDDYFRYGYVWV